MTKNSMKFLPKIFRSSLYRNNDVRLNTDPNSASVKDYSTKKSLLAALQGKTTSRSSCKHGGEDGFESTTESSSTSRSNSNSSSMVEWKIPIADEETSTPQTMEEEFHRLQVLKSYLILDTKEEEEFDRITNIAAHMFNAPTCLV